MNANKETLDNDVLFLIQVNPSRNDLHQHFLERVCVSISNLKRT